MTKLMLYLSPIARELTGMLPKGHMPVFPFYTSVSRLNYKPDAFEFKLMSEPASEIINRPNHNLSFSDICDNRSIEINQVDGRIFVMWSGGIDSTTVLASILKNWSSADRERVTVLCNYDSIKENKGFFPFVSKNFTIENSTHDIESFLKQGHVVTGELGDQLFGFDFGPFIDLWGFSILEQPWQEVVPRMFNTISADHGASYFEKYKPILEESPFEIKKTFDFWWWLNFSQKWQHVKLRTLATKSWTNPKIYFPKLINFFDTVDFQVWSVNNHDKKIKNSWLSYKYESKEYVIDYTKDQTYMNKLKLQSLQNLFIGTEFHWSIDEEWNFLDKEQTLLRLRNQNEY